MAGQAVRAVSANPKWRVTGPGTQRVKTESELDQTWPHNAVVRDLGIFRRLILWSVVPLSVVLIPAFRLGP